MDLGVDRREPSAVGAGLCWVFPIVMGRGPLEQSAHRGYLYLSVLCTPPAVGRPGGFVPSLGPWGGRGCFLSEIFGQPHEPSQQ